MSRIPRGPAAGDSSASMPPGVRGLGIVVVHVPALILALVTIVLAGQPIYANDTWIHLALGEAFAAQGPWLTADPFLYAAPGPPSPSSWLGSVAIFGTQSAFGFTGLRILHAAFVSSILALAWVGVRRVTASAQAASAALLLFILLSTYRLVQLRPDLFTMAATLVLFLILIAGRSGPRTSGIAAAVVLSLFWANIHAAFILGPLLVLGVSASLWALPLLPGVSSPEPEDRLRAARLGLTGVLMLIASGANPEGWKAHLAYFASGHDTLALGAVADEWGTTNLLAAPALNLPPTWAAWVVCWLCVLATTMGAWRVFSELRASTPPRERTIDPAVLALSVAGLVAAILASRFLWLGIFSLAVGGSLLFSRTSSQAASPSRAFIPALMGAGLLAGSWLHLTAGDWVLVSRSFRAPGADYREPYYAGKFSGHAVWFLADSGVKGRIYNDYPLGGFMSFWLAPDLQMASSGTMNVALEAMEANLAIANRMPIREGESFLALLDRQGIDLFLGRGLPIEAIPGRRNPSTVHHLEAEVGWIPVFRSLSSAVYLRLNARNVENLARIGEYYAREGVPFDPESGFDPERAISRATNWAIDHGIAPSDFPALIDSVRAAAGDRVVTISMHRLATIYATLGLYERALGVDRLIRRIESSNLEATRRQLWCLMRLGRNDEALELVDAMASEPSGGASGEMIEAWRGTVQQMIDAGPGDRLRQLSYLPLYRSDAAAPAQAGMLAPRARIERATQLR